MQEFTIDGIVFKSVRSYNKSTSTSYEAQLGHLNLSLVKGHIYFPDGFVFHCYDLGFNTKPLGGATTFEQAATQALNACREKLKDTVVALFGGIVEVKQKEGELSTNITIGNGFAVNDKGDMAHINYSKTGSEYFNQIVIKQREEQEEIANAGKTLIFNHAIPGRASSNDRELKFFIAGAGYMDIKRSKEIADLKLKLIDNQKKPTPFNELEIGDKVCIEFTGGLDKEPPVIGYITRISPPNEYPEISIDGEDVDLVSEGHSSNVYLLVSKWHNPQKEKEPA